MTDHSQALDVAQLVSEHSAELYRYAYRLSGSVADAEDLTQQTFLQAQANLGQLRDPAAARSWLFAILRNSYQMFCRRQNRSPVESWGDGIDDVPEIDDESPVDGEALQAALNEIPDEYKVALLLYYFEECSYREIAEQLNVPIGTVMSRLSRGKERLRERLYPADKTAPSAASTAADRREE